jgi:hypothetical protein
MNEIANIAECVAILSYASPRRQCDQGRLPVFGAIEIAAMASPSGGLS